MDSERTNEFGIAAQARADATGGKFTPNPFRSEQTDVRSRRAPPGPSCPRPAGGAGR